MIIRKYGIVLRRLKQEHIEMVRVKRNTDAIREHMFFQEIITPEMQQAWFDSIYNIHHYYFIIEYNNKQIGMINGKKVDYKAKTSEGGIFIWDENYWNSFVPVIASVCMADVTFNAFGFEKTFAEVQKSNTQQVSYNQQMGYELVQNEDSERQLYVLTRDRFFNKGQKIREAVMKISKDHSEVSWNDFDFSDVTPHEIEHLYSGLPPAIQQEVDQRLP